MARAQCACTNDEECTRCIHRAEHWPCLRNESCSLSLSRSFRYLFSKTRRHHPDSFSTPSSALYDQEVVKQSAGRSCASPIEMHRFHYKLLMRQICLSASRCLCRPPLSCAVIVSTADNNIWATLSRMAKESWERKSRRGQVRFRSLSGLFSGERGSYV